MTTKVKYNDYIKSIKWIDKKKKALERDNYSCRKCGCKENLHVHHASYRRLGTEKVSDLFTLCAKCHKTFHEIYGTHRDMISLTKKFLGYIKPPKKEYTITKEIIDYIKDGNNFKSQSIIPLKVWKKLKNQIRKGLL